MLPYPAAVVVSANAGDKLHCSATGVSPIYTALILNSTVLANATGGTVAISLFEGGNYSCLATNKFGTDLRVISVVVSGETQY